MFKSVASLTTVSLILACCAISFCAGCDGDQGKADTAAQQQIAKAEADRVHASDPSQLDAIQQQYDSLATTQGLSPQMQIVVRAAQAQLRLERSMKMVADLRTQELEIVRAINDIEQMGLQISGAQNNLASLKKYDPTSQIADIKDRESKITDGPGTDDAPTVASLDAQIQSLSAAIEKNKSDNSAQHDASAKARDQGETLVRQSEAETGDQQLQDTIQASDFRKQASFADTVSDTLNGQLANLQLELQTAKDRKATLQATVATLDSQISAMQAGWTSVQQQIDGLQKLQQSIIGTDSSTESSIALRAGELQKMISDAGTLRDTVKDELDKAADEFGQAATLAQSNRSTLIQQTSRGNNDDPDSIIWKQMMETLHPRYYSLQQAAAKQARASVAAGEVSINVVLGQLMNGYTIPSKDGDVTIPGMLVLLSKDQTGVDVPTALSAIASDVAKIDPATIKTSEADVDTRFQDALDTYYNSTSGGTDSGPEAKERNLISHTGHAAANRQWAQYSFEIGDTTAAQKHQADAANDITMLHQGTQSDDTSSSDNSNAAPAPAPTDNTTTAPSDTSNTGAGTGTDTSTPATAPDAAPAAAPPMQ